MFDTQRLLAQILREATGLGASRRRHRQRESFTGLPRGIESKVGMGVLALAVAAYEHFAKSGEAAAASIPNDHAAMPPPPPITSADSDKARHLLRAMVAAAHADGVIDAQESSEILDHGRAQGLSPAALGALEAEFRAPLSLAQLIEQTPAAWREQVYMAAHLGINADHAEEQRFLEQLATGLGLDIDARKRILEQAASAPQS